MTNHGRIVLVTCRAWPDISVSDAELATELRRCGYEVDAQPWNDAPISAFTSADLVVLRSNWDYHHDLEAFEEWLDTVESSPAKLYNDAVLVRDHLHKGYLCRFADLGVQTAKTLVLGEFDARAIRSWASDLALDQVVLKPAWGASGHDVCLVHLSDLDGASTQWEASERRDLLAQSLVPEIHEGETSPVFFGESFSHAILRRPAADDFRANSQYGCQMGLAPLNDPTKIEFAQTVLSMLPMVPTYARVDVVGTGDNVTLMELELNEPALGLHLAAGAAARFADVLLGRSK